MNTRILVLSFVVWGAGSAAWSQGLPPPPPSPDAATGLPGPPSDPAAAGPQYPAQQPAYAAPPSGYSPQPGGYAPSGPYAPSGSPSPYAPSGPYGPPVVYPPSGPYTQPPGAYPPPPPGAVVVPEQPYPYVYPPHGRPVVIVPAPPIPSYQWSASIDALFLERSSGGSIYLGSTEATTQNPVGPPQDLYSDDASFPLQAGIRLQLDRKLTDTISLSATYWGLQQWSVGNTIYADPANDTLLAYSPWLQMPTLLNGMDTSLGYTYASQINNVEFNALFRLNGDNPYWQINWLWGARYINLSDQFTLTGIDTYNSASENVGSSTSNNLLGVQTGLLVVRGWDRFQWETGVKAGLMGNIYRQHYTDAASEQGAAPAGFNPIDQSNSGCGLAGVFEFSLVGRMRLTDVLWLRLGYQAYDITGMALGPRQLGAFGHGGNVALDGLSIGLQATW